MILTMGMVNTFRSSLGSPFIVSINSWSQLMATVTTIFLVLSSLFVFDIRGMRTGLIEWALKKNMRAGRFDASHQQQEIHETRKKLGRGSIWGYDLACHVDCRTGYRTAGCRTGFRTAGCRTGCRTAGCRTAGCRTGCRTAGCRTAGCRTVGCRTVGCRTAGCRTAGCRTAGCRTAGLRTAAGCCTAGCRTAGCQTACLVACHAGLAAGSADRHCRSGRLALVRECRRRIQGYLTKSLETEHLTFCHYTAYTKGAKTWHYVASMVGQDLWDEMGR